MSALRFHHVFFVLMLLALLSAFGLSAERSAKLAPQVQSIFAPIARPASALGRWVDRRLHPPEAPKDGRSIDVLRAENDALILTNASLLAKLDEMIKLNGAREALGDVGAHARQFAAMPDAGNIEALSIGGSSLTGLALHQPVIYNGGIAGRVVQVGLTGAKVLLITDRAGAKVLVTFGRVATGETGPIGMQYYAKELKTPVSGAGRNTLVSELLTMKAVQEAGIRVGDYALLSDPEWPDTLQGYRVGQVQQIVPRPDSPLFARIVISPGQELKLLRNVSVVVK